ncbi:type II secretion system protein [Ideonella sp. DXS29W]|uniref:Type II secretion system protein n=1 Tax=Ideonella lacteola TaxID=2984193 RepID=A0ABU9BNK0_9BURK
MTRQRHATGNPPAGFTLVELLITLAVLALLATVAAPLAQVTYQRAKERELRLALREIRTAIDAYKTASDQGRIRKDAGASGYPASLERLVEGEEDQADPKKRKMFFLRRVPRDPMSDDTDRDAVSSWALRSYASEAADPRAGEDVYDVHSRSTVQGLNGVAYTQW